jgi:pyridoxal phosphate enzyme (YggS family)
VAKAPRYEPERDRGDAVDRLEERLAARVAALRAELAGLGAGHVRIVAVTKTHPLQVVAAALRAGLEDLGENYAQELVAKARALEVQGASARWHFIGQIQRNKLAELVPLVSVIQSVSRATELARLGRLGFAGEVFVQVAPPGAGEGRGGAASGEVPALVEQGQQLGLQVVGLMAVAMPGPEAEVGKFFRSVRALGDALDLREFSMGMSGDYRIAVREGATILRLGSAIFGPRAQGGARGGEREVSWHHFDG